MSEVDFQCYLAVFKFVTRFNLIEVIPYCDLQYLNYEIMPKTPKEKQKKKWKKTDEHVFQYFHTPFNYFLLLNLLHFFFFFMSEHIWKILKYVSILISCYFNNKSTYFLPWTDSFISFSSFFLLMNFHPN